MTFTTPYLHCNPRGNVMQWCYNGTGNIDGMEISGKEVLQSSVFGLATQIRGWCWCYGGVVVDSFTTFTTFTTAVMITIFAAAILTISDITIIVISIIIHNPQRPLSESKRESQEEGDANQKDVPGQIFVFV